MEKRSPRNRMEETCEVSGWRDMSSQVSGMGMEETFESEVQHGKDM